MKMQVCNYLYLICASYMNYSYILMLFNPPPLRFFKMYPTLVNLYNFLKVLKTNLFVNLPLQDSKDRRIQELTMEVEHQDQLCELYRGQLITFLKNVEEQTEVLSTKIEVAVNSVRKVESEGQKHSRHRQRQQSRVRTDVQYCDNLYVETDHFGFCYTPSYANGYVFGGLLRLQKDYPVP